MANSEDSHDLRCGGRVFGAPEIALIREVVATEGRYPARRTSFSTADQPG